MTESKRSEKGISLEKEVEDGWIEGERDLLVSALTNFLDNARKAVPDGGHIRMRGRPYVDGYVLGIFDDGCGMEPQELARITEAFYMVDKSRARKEGGAGLGMTLCSRILALHEVHWKIFSRPGEGTAILMRFDRKGEKQHATVE
jgi:signal transduction histidine kinase